MTPPHDAATMSSFGSAPAGVYETTAEPVGTMLRRQARITYPEGSGASSNGITDLWANSFNFTETYRPVHFGYGGGGVEARDETLRKELTHLATRTESHLQDLGRRLEALTSAFHAFCTQQSAGGIAELGSRSARDDVVVADDENALAKALNHIADGGTAILPEMLEEAQEGLRSDDAAVRAAAGRALAMLDPAEARVRLPAVIASEQNAFSASILRGALRAAKV